MRLLIAEDERSLNRILVRHFEREGYCVDNCFTGQEVLDFIASADYDAVILDVMMPEKDGFQALREIRSNKNSTPVILLTAKSEIDDKVYGLDCGANDYLVKPFEIRELSARVRAMIRNSVGNTTDIFEIADLEIDFKGKRVKRAGKVIELSAREYAILECLARNAKTVVSRAKIENSVWNFDYEGGTNVIDVYIRYLRKKIDEGFDKKLIQTVRGSGYVLRED